MGEKTIKDAIKEMMQIISKKIPDEHKRYPVEPLANSTKQPSQYLLNSIF